MKIKLNQTILKVFLIIVITCSFSKNALAQNVVQKESIIDAISKNKDSFYYINLEKYPTTDSTLPIGVFDSGTGGLTVLNAIVNYDQNSNTDSKKGSDGIPDFQKESFIYLGDQANMPYGNYSEVNKLDLLKEHIIKDAQFLLGSKYYLNANDTIVCTDKKPVKVIVIACNTATAYGMEYIEDFFRKVNLNIKIIGVIDAGARGVLETMTKSESGIIGVLATVGTVSSKGYPNTIMKFKKELGYSGNIEVFSQGGLGIAEAVDEDTDYYNRTLLSPRVAYKGPSLESTTKIDKTLFDIYNFDFENSKMLCDTKNTDDCSILQINDAENYVRYHVVTLLENIRNSKTTNQLKSIVLGCTHYPYLTKEIHSVLKELYNYKDKNGTYRYRKFMIENVKLIDPSVNTAKELHEFLYVKSLNNREGNIQYSEFYISAPNTFNSNTKIDTAGRFTYDYKYGRTEGQTQEYVKIVPFTKEVISPDALTRFKNKIPNVYQLMKKFNWNNQKTKKLIDSSKI